MVLSLIIKPLLSVIAIVGAGGGDTVIVITATAVQAVVGFVTVTV